MTENRSQTKSDFKPSSYKKSFILVFASALPGILATIILLVVGGYDALTITTVLFVVVLAWLGFIQAFHTLSIRTWQVVANILISFRENDYSIRARSTNPSDDIGLALFELNELAIYLQEGRLAKQESRHLISKVLNGVDAAIFLFNPLQRLAFINYFGAKLYQCSERDLLNQHISDLGLQKVLLAAHDTVHEIDFPAQKGYWLIRHNTYHEGGVAHRMILIMDIKKPLREEEFGAWRKLVRILVHELNNSMTPLKTTAVSMSRILSKDELPDGWRADCQQGLEVITRRIDNLNRLVDSYGKIAKQPEPVKSDFYLSSLLQRVSSAFPQKVIELIPGPVHTIFADESQLEQVFINVIKNAVEASEENSGKVYISWVIADNCFKIRVEDEGEGVKDFENLFVPYATTKKEGSGVGLFVTRQIVESHGGSIELSNRAHCPGCKVEIILPVEQDE